jgi:hypothetical protein
MYHNQIDRKEMPAVRKVPLRDLPADLKAKIHAHIRIFSVTLVVERPNDVAYACAGTLCTIAGNRGIVTARHVWEQLRRENNFLALAGDAHVSIEPQYLSVVLPSVIGCLSPYNAPVPDIAFIIVPEHYSASLEAYGKAFYSIDRRLSHPNLHTCEDLGYWAVYGAPQALLDPARRAAPSFIYGTTVSERTKLGSWDFLVISLDLDANPDLPRDFEGVSGGGVWCALYETNMEATEFGIDNPSMDIGLVGVNFLQTEPQGRKVIAHGPHSIFGRLHAEVKKAKGT